MRAHPLLIAIGGNLVPDGYESLLHGLETAIQKIRTRHIDVLSQSFWYQTAAVPVSDQPDFLNAVISCETMLDAHEVLITLQDIEAQFGRVRSVRNAARVLDLDIVDFDEQQMNTDELTVPHPRLQDRAFVLYPMRDVAPHWVHPRLGMGIDAMIDALPPGQEISRFESE